ncbi:hypothetical protein [Fluviispira sanaruensis]|uniref:Uncharacterized protein n=1 Tax=Fluviispira sanaruensis TaxID=2493639 RepID=A0A4P2VH17_FLUSA|nr:hypothetical protein [Fluviispira sanaruensis]BBH51941.1 hypothetical protein JCM31447_312200 [Fluviispira sanaruensis]
MICICRRNVKIRAVMAEIFELFSTRKIRLPTDITIKAIVSVTPLTVMRVMS